MKKLFMILLAASGSLANAQTKVNNPFAGKKPDPYHKHVMSLLKAQQAPVAHKTTAMKQRVIAQAGRDAGMNVIDSTLLKYTGTNGSRFDYNFMLYSYGHSSFGLTPNYYPYDFSQIDVKHDSLYSWADGGSGVLDAASISHAQHSSTGMLAMLEEGYFDNGAFDMATMYSNTFDAQGRLSQLVYLEDVGSGFDSVGKLVRTYNSNNKPVADTIYDYSGSGWDQSGMLLHTYASNGKLDTLYILSSDGMGGWSADQVYVHTHDNSGRLKAVVGYVDMGSGLMPVVADTFTYTGTNSFFTTLSEYQDNGSGLMPAVQLDKHINGAGLPDTMWINQYDMATSSWFPMVKMDFEYNTDNNPEEQIISMYNGGSFDLLQTTHYYYELFDDGIQNVHNTVKNADITLYPNPATSDLNMVWNEADGKRAMVEIINASGQKIASQSFNWKEKNQKISLGNLTPGIYWLIVKDASGVVTFRQSVVKQ